MNQHLGDLLYQANKTLIEVVNKQLTDLNLGYSQLQTLMTLVRLGEGEEVDQEALAVMMQVDKSNVSRNLSKMQKEGFVEMIQSDKDGRKKRIRLTAKATNSLDALKGILWGINDNMTAGFSKAELELMMLLLTRMIENLEEMK